MSGAWRIAAAATFSLIAVEFAWNFTAAPLPIRWWLLASFLSLPLLFPALLFLLGRPRAPLWAGIVALLYFCQGVVGVRTDFEGSGWPWLVLVLSLLVIFAAGWPGIAAKIAKRRAAPPPNV